MDKEASEQKNFKTYTFTDASNLFYGGLKSLGWKIDYYRLLNYLKRKYNATEIFYFGGVEIHNFKYDYISNETVPIVELEKYLINFIKEKAKIFNEAELLLLSRHLQKIKFYLKLQQFGYILILKPVKLYEQEDGTTRRKANCDVEMTFRMMMEKDNFDQAVILSGDGDFLPVLKHLRDIDKNVVILARGSRTAREIRQFTGSNFRDFTRLKNYIKFDEK